MIPGGGYMYFNGENLYTNNKKNMKSDKKEKEQNGSDCERMKISVIYSLECVTCAIIKMQSIDQPIG